MPPRGRPNPQQTVNAEKNRVKAMDMHIAGLTYRQIAERLGVSVSTAHDYVSHSLNELRELRHDKAEEVRQVAIERLEDAWSRLYASEAYQAGDPQAINAARGINESLRKLFGSDAPARSDVTTGGEKLPATFNVVVPPPRDKDNADE